MARKLPPLNSLKCFEAAGRLLSFTRAAQELNVTQAAVSHQIKVLEEFLEMPLFLRLPRKIILTEEGRALLSDVIEAFDKISVSISALSETEPNNVLNVRLSPSFSAKWLSPRLKYFWMSFPEIDLCLYHANAAADFDRENIDLAVTYGRGDWPGVVVEPLLTLDFFPVCTPAFMANDRPLTDINNLRYYTLLHDVNFECWQGWLRLSGIEHINAHKGTIIDDTNVLIQAAIDGQGVALGSTPFVADHLESGRLIRPFETTLRNDFAYYVVCPKSHLRNPAVAALWDWLLSHRE